MPHHLVLQIQMPPRTTQTLQKLEQERARLAALTAAALAQEQTDAVIPDDAVTPAVSGISTPHGSEHNDPSSDAGQEQPTIRQLSILPDCELDGWAWCPLL